MNPEVPLLAAVGGPALLVAAGPNRSRGSTTRYTWVIKEVVARLAVQVSAVDGPCLLARLALPG